MLRRSPALYDGAFIGVVVTLSLLWYLPGLGFYSDDWAFLGMYATSADQTVRGFYDASHSPQHAMRPVQLWLCAALYGLFGLDPLGYHLVNAVFVVLNPLLVYAIGRELRLSRVVALPVALVYGLLPNYSSDRFWFVAFAITLSMTAALASIYADLRGWRARRAAGALIWKGIALAGLCVSVLAYEVPLPLLLCAAPASLAWQLWHGRTSLTRRRILQAAAFAAVNIVAIAGLVLFKLQTTVRLGAEQGLAAQVSAIVRHAVRFDLPRGEYGLNAFNAVRVHFVEYGAQLPVNAIALVRTAPAGLQALTLAAAVAILLYLAVVLRSEPWPGRRAWLLAAAAGVVVFALGYAIFLTNYNVQFTTTGIANRSAIAAALGAAMCLVGGVGLLVALLPTTRTRSLVFALGIAAIGSSGFAIVNVLAERWVKAYRIERDTLENIRTRFAALPPQSTLLLDGVCPYVGPAIVFEADWDFTGALQVYYRTRSAAANVVTPRMTAEDEGIAASIYGQPKRYPYSPSLFAYHAGSGTVQPLPDRETARAWLARSLAGANCPPGHEGLGVEPF
ncbi:MAG TPA: hypothetical protein VFK57_03310 [Vicinamibacterales bacterium]|nr:hypothetical protein [Vicinamibacterales bacterium]